MKDCGVLPVGSVSGSYQSAGWIEGALSYFGQELWWLSGLARRCGGRMAAWHGGATMVASWSLRLMVDGVPHTGIHRRGGDAPMLFTMAGVARESPKVECPLIRTVQVKLFVPHLAWQSAIFSLLKAWCWCRLLLAAHGCGSADRAGTTWFVGYWITAQMVISRILVKTWFRWTAGKDLAGTVSRKLCAYPRKSMAKLRRDTEVNFKTTTMVDMTSTPQGLGNPSGTALTDKPTEVVTEGGKRLRRSSCEDCLEGAFSWKLEVGVGRRPCESCDAGEQLGMSKCNWYWLNWCWYNFGLRMAQWLDLAGAPWLKEDPFGHWEVPW